MQVYTPLVPVLYPVTHCVDTGVHTSSACTHPRGDAGVNISGACTLPRPPMC